MDEKWSLLHADQLQLQGSPGEGSSGLFATTSALEEYNTFLRRSVEEKEEGITELEHKLARMEARETGIQFIVYRLLFHACTEK